MSEFICTIEQGQLKGHQLEDVQGRKFIGFCGIPYAKPPVGNLRFKAPQEPEKWDGIRDATKEGKSCYAMQANFTPQGTKAVAEGSEDDGLVLNVFTHKVSDGDLKPVMMFIPGGAFTTGTGNPSIYGPELLMTEDIVLVSINYRLGALGFLAFDDPSLEVLGNAGLKDQVQALKWIQKNIKQFGGDPDNVTIFGISAGGASVHFLLLSPLAKGLFHKAIVQSGSALNPWTRGVNNFRMLANKLGCTEHGEKEILEFLQSVPALDIVQAQHKFGDWLDAVEKRPFAPSIEKKSPTSFISEDPLKTLRSGNYNQVPVMIGYTSLEGMLLEIAHPSMFVFNTKEFVPYTFGYHKNHQKFQELNKKICEFYFGTEKVDKNNKEALYNVITDTSFLRGIHNSVKIQAKSAKYPIYYYRMSLDGNLNAIKALINNKNVKGACHGDDIGYLFKSAFLKFAPDETTEIGYKRYVKMWTNFAKTGNPIPVQDSLLNTEWKPVTEDELNFLDIGKELVPGVNPDQERMKFWDEIQEDLGYRYSVLE